MEVNGCQTRQQSGYQQSSKYLFFICVQQKKETHTRLEQLEGK